MDSIARLARGEEAVSGLVDSQRVGHGPATDRSSINHTPFPPLAPQSIYTRLDHVKQAAGKRAIVHLVGR